MARVLLASTLGLVAMLQWVLLDRLFSRLKRTSPALWRELGGERGWSMGFSRAGRAFQRFIWSSSYTTVDKGAGRLIWLLRSTNLTLALMLALGFVEAWMRGLAD